MLTAGKQRVERRAAESRGLHHHLPKRFTCFQPPPQPLHLHLWLSLSAAPLSASILPPQMRVIILLRHPPPPPSPLLFPFSGRGSLPSFPSSRLSVCVCVSYFIGRHLLITSQLFFFLTLSCNWEADVDSGLLIFLCCRRASPADPGSRGLKWLRSTRARHQLNFQLR